jgi:hypothetical protein
MAGRTPLEVAEWMAERVTADGQLYQHDAVHQIEMMFGEQFVCEKNGRPAIVDGVLRKFTQLTKETVVWNAYGLHWRPREPGDAPGRTQR